MNNFDWSCGVPTPTGAVILIGKNLVILLSLMYRPQQKVDGINVKNLHQNSARLPTRLAPVLGLIGSSSNRHSQISSNNFSTFCTFRTSATHSVVRVVREYSGVMVGQARWVSCSRSE
jgi:hypothetical protein